LQLYLIGHDPRDACTDVPAEAFVDLGPVSLDLGSLASGNFSIEFEFPADYMEFFEFRVQQSTDIDVIPFADFNHGPLNSTGPDLWQIDLGIPASVIDRNIFRLALSLSN